MALREALQYEPWIMLHLFTNHDADLYPARIAEELGLPQVSVHRSLKRLEKKKFVRRKILGPLKIYKLTESGNKYALELVKSPDLATMYMRRVGRTSAQGREEQKPLSTSTLDDFREEVALRLRGFGFSEEKINRIKRLLGSK